MSFDWGSVIGAVASLYGSKKQSDAAKDAGKQSAAGAEQDAALQKYIYDDQRGLAMPGYQRGEWAGNTLAQYLGMPAGAMSQPTQAPMNQQDAGAAYLAANPDVAATRFAQNPYEHYQLYGQKEGRQWGAPAQQAQAPAAPADRSSLYSMFRNQPGYQFGLDEGNKQIQSSAAAGGGLLSGKTLKALNQYGQNYADQKGWQPYINSLQSMAGLSQTASSQIGSAGQNYANQAGQAFQNAGNARADSTYGSANAWANGINNAAAFGGQWYQNTYGGGR